MKFSWHSRSLVWMLALGALGAACAKRTPDASTTKRAAVRIGDDTISVDEIDKRIAPELFELRSQAMRAVLVDRLLQREARRRGVDLNQLRQLEIDAKVPMPTDAEGLSALAQWVTDGRLKPEEAARMTPALAADRLRSLRMNEAEEAYYDRLMKESAVKIDFAALGKPELKIALDGPTLGPDDAAIKIVEFADLSQSFTSSWQPTLEKLVDKYQARVQFRFKQKPSGPDTDGAKLAEGALCAGDQGHYWEFRKALFQHKGAVGASALAPAAAAARLDVAAFEACVASGSKRPTVAENAREAARNRLEGEPVVSINGIVVSGAQDLATIERLMRLESGVL
jgi:protein-disulfide isomerase